MATSGLLNVIVAGLGGQGVLTLTKVLWRLAEQSGLQCQSSTFKGGAQKHGSIHSVVRIFLEHNPDYERFSLQISRGELDLMIGLEAWETVRYHHYFGDRTRVFTSTETAPFIQERHGKPLSHDPLELIERTGLPAVSRPYGEEARRVFGTPKMANYLIGLDVLRHHALPFEVEQYIQVFTEQVRLEPAVKDRMLEAASAVNDTY